MNKDLKTLLKRVPVGDEGRAGDLTEDEVQVSPICMMRELRFRAFPGQCDRARVEEGNFRCGEDLKGFKRRTVASKLDREGSTEVLNDI